MTGPKTYFKQLSDDFGAGWNRFWFTPSDPLALCLIRLLAGLVALGLYLSYLPDLQYWFGPDGIISRDLSLELRGSVRVFSMFDYAESAGSLWTLFWLGAVMIGLFAIGLFSRVTSVLALIAYLSLIHRGPVVARPVDDILAFVMLYLCLSPCGAELSLDAIFRRKFWPDASAEKSSPRAISAMATIATRLMQVHLTAVYVAMGVSKLKAPVWWEGNAVWGLIVKPESRLVDLTFMSSDAFSYLINAWTLSIVIFELAFAVLIWNRRARPLMLALALPMFLSTTLLTGMMSWALMMLIANLAFVSPGSLHACFARKAEG